ncbi:MAG: tRNA (adenosine(37)-N6)-threonylcarbamoyltransferase complex ATPase subunit type 1 TsaE [Coriobacteriia bacterium]|nr:tRNA (adenosine(37)-N6)-threonylcarbamoyltransferase complex ATPase subunit type 1 TsaE [Coriobacteriia bacterium]
MKGLLTHSAEETIAFGAALGRVTKPGDVLVLTGDLGAGKTQFAKGIAQGLGIAEAVTSPTFNIMLVYEANNGQRLNHLDLYRLDDPAQLDDIDYFGCLESDAVSLVEWGDKFPTALPLEYLEASFELMLSEEDSLKTGEFLANTRMISLVAHGSRAVQLLQAWQAEGALVCEEGALVLAEDASERVEDALARVGDALVRALDEPMGAEGLRNG